MSNGTGTSGKCSPCGLFRRLEDSILLSPKIIYSVVSAAFYAFYMFRAKLIKDYLLLDSDQYGDLAAIMALVSFAFMTLWGSFADALGRHRLVLVSLCVLMALALELCMFVGDIERQMVRFILAAGALGLYSFFACGLLPLTDYLTLRILTDKPGFSKDMYGKQRLWGTISYGFTTYVVGVIIDKKGPAALFYIVPLTSLLAVSVLFCLAPRDKPKSLREAFQRRPADEGGKAQVAENGEEAGKDTGMIQRSSPLPKESEGSIKEDNEKDEKPLKSEDAKLASPPNSTTTINLPSNCNSTAAATAVDPSSENGKMRRPIVRLLCNPNYLFMLLAVFMTGSARAVMTTFLGKYWDDSGLKSQQIGLAANFGIVMEVVIFFFGPLCIRTIGTYWMLVIAQLAMVLRCWAYVVLPVNEGTVWMVYMVELLKGVAFGFTQTSGVKLASDAAPAGLEATAQALYTSVYSQLPAVLTAFAGGRVYKLMGPTALFLITSIVMSVALILFTIKYVADGSIRLFCLRPRDSNANRRPPLIVSS